VKLRSIVMAPVMSLMLVTALASCGSSPPPSNPPVPSCGGAGTICTWAGTGEPAFNGDGFAPLQTALYWPMDVEFAADGSAGYILDWQNHSIRRATADKVVTVIGTDEPGDGPVYGNGDETTAPGVLATNVSLNHPTDIQLTSDGRMIIAAWHNHKIRTVELSTDRSEVACGRGPGFAGDKGTEAAALLNMPKAIALAPSGDLFIADTRNFRVRRVAADTGVIDTVVGTGVRGAAGDGGDPLAAGLSFQKGLDQGTGDGDNPEPGGALALDATGLLYIADTENNRIRRVDFALGVIETVAGDGTAGFTGDGGPATAAALNRPRDIEIGPRGRLFIADTENHRVRVVDLESGVIGTVAGNGEAAFAGDGALAAAASLWRPFGVAFDPAGDLYISDTYNNRIRRVVQP
jgi:sugar lactone lactonase YvrE